MHVITPMYVHCGFGALLTLISVPLVLRKVPMNHFYGVRIPKAFASDSNWYAINAYGGKLLLGYGLAVVAFGLLARNSAPAPTNPWMALFMVAPLVLVLPVLGLILSYAHRLPD